MTTPELRELIQTVNIIGFLLSDSHSHPRRMLAGYRIALDSEWRRLHKLLSAYSVRFNGYSADWNENDEAAHAVTTRLERLPSDSSILAAGGYSR